jgi:MFS transporter, DHA1 family, inner membrane transport protein
VLRPRLKLTLLALGAFAIGTDLFVIAGILPGVAADLRTSVAVAGQLVTVFAVAYALTSPLLAAATGRIERKQLLVVALAVFAAANALAAVAPSYWVLVVSRVAAAAGAGMFMPAAAALAAGLVPAEQRGRALATITAGLSVAQVAGVPIGIALGTVVGWRATFGLVAFLGGIAAVGVAAFLPRVAAPPAAGMRARLEVARRPLVLMILAVTSIGLAASFTTFTYLAPVVRHTLGLDARALSPLTLLFGLLGVGGNALGGWMADRFGGARAAAASLTGGTVGIALVAIAATLAPKAPALTAWALLMLGIVLWALLGSGFIPAQQHRLIGFAPEAPPVAIALNSVAIYVGITVAGALGGAALAIGGPEAVTRASVALAALGSLLALLNARGLPAAQYP